ncbi:uncharacterized protein LOC115588980 [Sparus aurata]|uniref:uncharacterized protein LOC115588980 n=1 Tax=Sparus aurata TaxID=8175 RepID=UPI0011C1698E|nr:uncharacterized protein LOC115588980 [Sparus aurata]
MYYSYEQLPGSSSGTEQDSYIVHGQAHTAGFLCGAQRKDRQYTTYYSGIKYVWSSDIHSSASLTVSPDRAQHFTSDSVSLSCEGNSAEWRVKRFSTEDSDSSACYTWWGTMTGSTCNINTDSTSDAVYWCESGSGEFSNAFNITVQAVSRPDSSSFPVLLVVGLVCGIVLVIPLLVLFCYRASKDSGFVRPVHSESTNADHVDYENDHYSALLHGDIRLYNAIGDRQEAEHDSGFVRPVQSESANVDHVDDENDHYSALLHGDVCPYDTIRGRQEAEYAQ